MTSGMDTGAPHGDPGDRLESWKEIAAHFRRGVTTVQRWERDEALPVHRHPHAKKGSVYAYRDELDTWRQTRSESALADDEPEENGLDALPISGSQPEPGRSVGRRRVYALAAVLAGMAIWLTLGGIAAFDRPAAGSVSEADRAANGSADPSPLTRVPLQMATATFSQAILGGPFTPSQAIDRYFNPSNGWTIARGEADKMGSTQAEVAVWETVMNVSAAQITFRLHFRHFNPTHLLGHFRFSVTTDDRELFADESHTGGKVDANWLVLTNPAVVGPAGMTFTTLADHSVLASGKTADEGVYSVSYSGTHPRITGIRLEALKHPSLPGGGPGLYTPSGNFFLTEIEMLVAEQPYR